MLSCPMLGQEDTAHSGKSSGLWVDSGENTVETIVCHGTTSFGAATIGAHDAICAPPFACPCREFPWVYCKRERGEGTDAVPPS